MIFMYRIAIIIYQKNEHRDQNNKLSNFMVQLLKEIVFNY